MFFTYLSRGSILRKKQSWKLGMWFHILVGRSLFSETETRQMGRNSFFKPLYRPGGTYLWILAILQLLLKKQLFESTYHCFLENTLKWNNSFFGNVFSCPFFMTMIALKVLVPTMVMIVSLGLCTGYNT